MSGQWEVVGKKKSREGGLSKKVPGENKKAFISNTPKVEEVLTLQQMRNLFKPSSKSKENRKLQEKVKVQENGSKKIQKKVDKPQEPPKPKPPKTIESALNSIDVEELKLIYEERKNHFPDCPIIWLKDIVQFLSQRVPIEVQDPTFLTKPEGYPFSIVPALLKNVIDKSLEEAGESNVQLFFDLALTTMVNDMGKNSHTLGLKLYIQHIAITKPNFVLTNLNKHVTLRNSYQNRQPIGLSILWALGQSGVTDFHVGLKVFQEIMLPVIEMKNYARYTVKYLIDLINRHKNVNITTDQYLLIIDVAFANYKNYPNDLRKEMFKVILQLEQMLLSHNGNEKNHAVIEPLLKKLSSNNNPSYKNEICKVLVGCFKKDPTTFSSWSKCYTKSLPQSAILLNYIDENWSSTCNKFLRTSFDNLLNTYCATNEELLMKKRKEQGLLDADKAIKKLKNKMATKKSSGFSYRYYSYAFMVIIAGIIYYDIHRHGSWEKSQLCTTLKHFGVLDYSNKAMDRSLQGFRWLHLRIDEQFPGYYEKTQEYMQPYVQLARELGLVMKNMYMEKYPIVIASIESYAPGLLEESQKAVHNVWSTSVLYLHRSIDYLKTEVFVGQLAPENMQKVVYEAFNTTQQKAVEYYLWLYEKMQSNVK